MGFRSFRSSGSGPHLDSLEELSFHVASGDHDALYPLAIWVVVACRSNIPDPHPIAIRTPPVPSPRGLKGLGEGRLVARLRGVGGGRLELLEYCVPAHRHTRGLPPAVLAGVGAGVISVRDFPPRGLAAHTILRSSCSFALHEKARGSGIGP